jgi:Arc/MetJ-type ribon-helix-helix transcriptional regulator
MIVMHVCMTARVTISLPEEIADQLQREARRRGASVSELVRSAVEAHLHKAASGELPFASLGRSGTRHTARNAEDILRREWGRARRR